MGATPEHADDKPVTEKNGKVDSRPDLPARGDHPMFWGDPDFNPMVRKKSGDDF